MEDGILAWSTKAASLEWYRYFYSFLKAVQEPTKVQTEVTGFSDWKEQP